MGNIWFHSEWAIYQLNNQTGQIVRLTERDGFKKTDFELLPLPCLDSKGDVFFPLGGWAPGFFRIRPDNFISAPSSVYFQSLQINQKPFQLTTSIDDLHQLYLKYFQNKIEIETGIIDYYSKGKSRLRYKLEGNGMKESWKFAPYYSTIRYDGLAPGSYRLVVQASNAANEFNGPEKVLLIDISPPFWETWWFRILAVLAVILILYGIIQYRSRKLRQQNIQLEEKVLHRTKELKHSLEELRETQNQLIQSEKMASLGELTAGIAHEIQNPLNFINNFSEVNSELIDELSDEVKKGNLGEVEAIAKDIKENEQKIGHHGKRADAIVKSMLQHSRTSSGVKEPTDINALADEYLRLSYHGMRARDKSFNATLKTDFDPNLERMNVIPQDMGRVLLNLFNNAFYAVAEKKKQQGESYSPIVSVSTKKVAGRLEIRVKDNGNGIPQKVRDKIFQPFFTTKPTGEGTGLGLSLSYDIITKGHGGELKVDTKEGEWSEFIIYLH
jgi:signal transduction histidine kinase